MEHDVLCCSVCVAVGHRGCMDVLYIPQAAIGIESSFELLEVNVTYSANQLGFERSVNCYEDDL